MPSRFKFFWGSSINFPGPLPTGPFRDCGPPPFRGPVLREQARARRHGNDDHPALHLEGKLRGFAQESKGMDGPTFRERYERLLTEVEMDL